MWGKQGEGTCMMRGLHDAGVCKMWGKQGEGTCMMRVQQGG